jgi:hypothetical protein
MDAEDPGLVKCLQCARVLNRAEHSWLAGRTLPGERHSLLKRRDGIWAAS